MTRRRGRRVAVDVQARQWIAICALGSSCLSMGVCLGMAVAAWSLWLVAVAAIPAVSGALVFVAALPRDPLPPRIVLMPAPPLNTLTRVEVSGLRPGDKLVMTNNRPIVPPIPGQIQEIP